MKRQIFAPGNDTFRETVRGSLAGVSRHAWRAAGKQGPLGLAVDEETGGGGTPGFRRGVVPAEEFTCRRPGLHRRPYPDRLRRDDRDHEGDHRPFPAGLTLTRKA